MKKRSGVQLMLPFYCHTIEFNFIKLLIKMMIKGSQKKLEMHVYYFIEALNYLLKT